MKERATIQLLPGGRRLHLNDGPIDLIIGADGAPARMRCAYQAALDRFVTILDELSSELSLLRSRVTSNAPLPTGSIARSMTEAVLPYGHRCFITPMAAVAGAVAEAVLAAMTNAIDLSRAYVNNGGDIALHLAATESYTIGIVEGPESPSPFASAKVASATPIRGIATSGWRGRSFSLGIADAVTVLARTASEADAAATIIANAVNLPDHPAVFRVPAREIAPDSDLLDLPVTRGVGPLSFEEVSEALAAGATLAEELRARGLIDSAALRLRGQLRIVSPARDRFIEPPPADERAVALGERSRAIPTEARNLLLSPVKEPRQCPK